ncbi:Protein kinase-like domain [Pseudocohnilembus persalinus]|uniref:Protein kinase-like domain n=1 Tax=Pseudocohnilembus persalinus TaxID=266149 RepID=A0A0V0R139_PSEPJ|nr:Protein kinase-like domain [Pseudocohnilembus persalinus]|eukprot:KRX08254.1 Protein kinase-like domain [Pseudocohnilembus persalinus]
MNKISLFLLFIFLLFNITQAQVASYNIRDNNEFQQLTTTAHKNQGYGETHVKIIEIENEYFASAFIEVTQQKLIISIVSKDKSLSELTPGFTQLSSTGDTNYQESQVSCYSTSYNSLFFTSTNNYDGQGGERQISIGEISLPGDTTFNIQNSNFVIGGLSCLDGPQPLVQNFQDNTIHMICAGIKSGESDLRIYMAQIDGSGGLDNPVTLVGPGLTEVKKIQTQVSDSEEKTHIMVYNYNQGLENIVVLITQDGSTNSNLTLIILDIEKWDTLQEILIGENISDQQVSVSAIYDGNLLIQILYIDGSTSELVQKEVEVEFQNEEEEDDDEEEEENKNETKQPETQNDQQQDKEEESKIGEYAAVAGATIGGSAALGGVVLGLKKLLSLKRSSSKIANLDNAYKQSNKLNKQSPEAAKQELLQSETSLDQENFKENFKENNKNDGDINNPEIMEQVDFDSQFKKFTPQNAPFSLVEQQLFDKTTKSPVDSIDLQSIDQETFQATSDEQQFSMVETGAASALIINPYKSIEIPATAEQFSQYKNKCLALFKTEERTLANDIDFNRRKGKRFKLKDIIQLVKDMVTILLALEKKGKGHGCINPTNIYLTKNKLGYTSAYKTKIVGNQIKRGLISKIIQFAKKQSKKISQNLNEQLKVEPQNPEKASQYLSPEEQNQFFNEKKGYNPSKPSISSDIFSLGLILYEIMSLELVLNFNKNEEFKNKKVQELKINLTSILNCENSNFLKNKQKSENDESYNNKKNGNKFNFDQANKKENQQDIDSNSKDFVPQNSNSNLESSNFESHHKLKSPTQLTFPNTQTQLNQCDQNKEKNTKKLDNFIQILDLMQGMLEFDGKKRIKLEYIYSIVNKM